MHRYFEYQEKETYSSKFIKILIKFLNKKKAFEEAIKHYQKNQTIKKDLFESPKPIFNKYDILEFNGRNTYIFNKEKEQDTIILYFHGGAFLRNFYIFHWLFIKKLYSYSPYPIYAADYPLIPKHNYKEILSFSKELYLNLSKKYKIILIGDSAGGNLCLSVLQKLPKENLPKKILLLSPWLDVSMVNPLIDEYEKYDYILNKNGLKLAGDLYSNNHPQLPEVSPIYFRYDTLPETHLFIGTHDILYPDCELFYKNNINFMIYFYKFPKMVHDWMILDLIPFKEAKKVHEIIKTLL
jgi:monoterpene epsilon-lactone hydrolase